MITEIKKLSNGNSQIIARKGDKEVILTINEDLKVVHLDATEGWEKKAPQVEAEEPEKIRILSSDKLITLVVAEKETLKFPARIKLPYHVLHGDSLLTYKQAGIIFEPVQEAIQRYIRQLSCPRL